MRFYLRLTWMLVLTLIMLSTATGAILHSSSAHAAARAHATLDAITTTDPTGFTVSGNQTLRDGSSWTPYGFTISTFQVPSETFPKCSCEFSTVQAQLNAIKGAWHGNTVRFQIEQDEWLDGGSSNGYDAKVEAAISYAKQIGLVVVLNDQTEADGMTTSNETLPTAASVTFWQDMFTIYGNDPDIIWDTFNEPREAISQTLGSGWNDWSGGNANTADGQTYLGAQTYLNDIRALGYTGQVWEETPSTLQPLIQAGGAHYLVTDPDSNMVWSFHHVDYDENTNPDGTADFPVQFGDMVNGTSPSGVPAAPVVDGEWSNRSTPASEQTASKYQGGDYGVCWGNDPTEIPLYLTYLKSLNIGMTAWTMGTNPSATQYDYLNTDGDGNTQPFTSSSFTTKNNLGNLTEGTAKNDWHGCVTPSGINTQGSGTDLFDWFNGLPVPSP